MKICPHRNGGGGWVIVKTAARNAMGPGRSRMTTRGPAPIREPDGDDETTAWPAAGLVIVGMLTLVVLAVKRYD